MTQEEKAKAYDDALAKARNIYKDAVEMENNMTTKTCEIIFPELKESEDERVRKALIDFFSRGAENGAQTNGVYDKDIIAWLEKQGEPVEINPSEFESSLNTLLKQFEKLPKEELANSLSFYLNVVQNNGTYKDEEKQGEQKHKIQPKFKIGDIIRFKGNETLKGEVEAHEIVGYDNELYVFADGTTDLFCEQDLYELVEQKSVWSEEDEGFLDSALYHIQNSITNGAIKSFVECPLSIWLKSLKERVGCEVNCTTTKAWSEEDEETLKIIDRDLQELYSRRKAQAGSPLFESQMDNIRWLKSLKERYTWNPSKEQMNALRQAISGCSYDIEPLLGLETKLKGF